MARTKMIPKRGCYIKAKRLVLRTLHYLADAIMVYVAEEAIDDYGLHEHHQEEHSYAYAFREYMHSTRIIRGHEVDDARAQREYLHEFLYARYNYGIERGLERANVLSEKQLKQNKPQTNKAAKAE